MRLKISVNDMYALFDYNVERLSLILEALGVVFDRQNWREGRDTEQVAWRALCYECEIQTAIPPEELKIILSGAQYCEIPNGFPSKGAILVNEKKLARLADIDLLHRDGRFSLTWGKFSSKAIQRRHGLTNDEEFVSFSVEEYRKAVDKAPKDLIERISRIEQDLLREQAGGI